jgi:hypothetical protein
MSLEVKTLGNLSKPLLVWFSELQIYLENFNDTLLLEQKREGIQETMLN